MIKQSLTHFTLGLGLLAALASAQASPFETTNTRFETPIGMRGTSEIESASTARRDENFNKTITGKSGAEFTSTAIGNLISVEMGGSNNTVIVNAQQINKGSQRAWIDRNTSTPAQ